MANCLISNLYDLIAMQVYHVYLIWIAENLFGWEKRRLLWNFKVHLNSYMMTEI